MSTNMNNKVVTMSNLDTINEERGEVVGEVVGEAHTKVHLRKPKKPTRTYWVPERYTPSFESVAYMEKPHPSLLCDDKDRRFYTSSRFHSPPTDYEPNYVNTMTAINDHFEILAILGDCNKWQFTDWETNEIVDLVLKQGYSMGPNCDSSDGGGGYVLTKEGEEIGSWGIELGVASFSFIQVPDDVSTLYKKKLNHRIRIRYKSNNGSMRESLMYIVRYQYQEDDKTYESFYLQEEMSWFRIISDTQGRHVVKMVDIYGRPVRSAVQYCYYLS